MSSAKCDNPGTYKYILLYLYLSLSQETRQGVAESRVGFCRIGVGRELGKVQPVPGTLIQSQWELILSITMCQTLCFVPYRHCFGETVPVSYVANAFSVLPASSRIPLPYSCSQLSLCLCSQQPAPWWLCVWGQSSGYWNKFASQPREQKCLSW